MSTQKFRWSRVYESSEEELMSLFAARNLTAQQVNAEAGSEPLEHTTKASMTLWCAEGSLTLYAEQSYISLQPGDAVRIDAKTSYSLTPGISGFICYTTTQ